MEHQDLGKRVIAYIIDMLVISVAASVYGNIISCGNQIFFEINFGVQARDNIIFAFIYFVFFALLNNGKTLGKIALHLHVARLDGNSVPQNQMVLREALKALLLPLAIVSLILAIVVDNQQTLHDLIMKTTVQEDVEEFKEEYHEDENQEQDDDKLYYD